jgi:phage terminase large subunit-like protein
VRHVGAFSALEDQMVSWEPLGSEHSPDRVDALVWALSELMLGGGGPAVFNIF